MAKPRTLYDKIWDAHLVDSPPGETPVLYIDRHLVHEVTSPQAFEGLRMTGRKVRRPEACRPPEPNRRESSTRSGVFRELRRKWVSRFKARSSRREISSAAAIRRARRSQ